MREREKYPPRRGQIRRGLGADLLDGRRNLQRDKALWPQEIFAQDPILPNRRQALSDFTHTMSNKIDLPTPKI